MRNRQMDGQAHPLIYHDEMRIRQLCDALANFSTLGCLITHFDTMIADRLALCRSTQQHRNMNDNFF